MRKLALCLGLAFALGTANATVLTFTATLSGPNESPPNASPGTGFVTVLYDNTAHTLGIDVSFSGLLGTTTASHIHCCTTIPLTGTAGVATTTPSFTGFPLGLTSGSFNNTSTPYDLTQASSWNPAFVSAHGGTTAGAEAFFATGLSSGTTYFNIHTSVVGGGEIRGFLTESVPEPGTVSLVGLGVLALGAFVRRRAL